MLDLLLSAMLLQGADPCHAVGAAGPLPAACPRWRALARNEDYETFIDPASLRRSGDGFEILERVVLHVAEDGVRSTVLKVRYACGPRTAVALAATRFDAAGATLRVVPPAELDPEPFEVPPGSVNEAILTEYCPR